MYVITIIGTVLGLLVVIGGVAGANGAPQEAAAAGNWDHRTSFINSATAKKRWKINGKLSNCSKNPNRNRALGRLTA